MAAIPAIPVGYGGFVPGLISENIHGAPWKVSLAFDA
jgi:hypothetical protein